MIDAMPPLDRKALFCDVVKKSFENILEALEKNAGIDRRDGNFKDTPARVARAYGEILDGMFGWEYQMVDILTKTFPSKSKEMITVGPVNTWTVCAHHFLPVELNVWIGYMPDKRVLGLSKLARIAELMTKRPGLQEDATVDIVSAIQKGLMPKGCGCYIRGRHLCMEMRGIKKKAITTTTQLAGNFLKQEIRSEFLEVVRADIEAGKL